MSKFLNSDDADFKNQGFDEEYNENDDFVYVDNEEDKEEIEDDNKRSLLFWIILGFLLLLFLIFGIILAMNIFRSDDHDDWLEMLGRTAIQYTNENDAALLACREGNKDRVFFQEMIDSNHLTLQHLINPRTNQQVGTCNFVSVTCDDSGVRWTSVEVEEDCENWTRQPTITLIGDHEIEIALNETYEDEGATARDWTGIDITDRINVDNTVNTSRPGCYEVIFNVSNVAGVDAESVTRVVCVEGNVETETPRPPAPRPPAGGGTTTPRPPAPRPPAGGGTTTVARPTITARGLPRTITVGQTVNYSITFRGNVNLRTIRHCVNSTCRTETVNARTRTVNLTYRGTATGTFRISATATDIRGNTRTVNLGNIVVTRAPDRTPPTITSNLTNRRVFVGQTQTFNITFRDNVALRSITSCISTTCNTQSATGTSRVLPIRWTPTTTGTFVVRASAIDAAGNRSGTITLGTITVVNRPDTTPPTAIIVGGNQTFNIRPERHRFVVRITDDQSGVASYTVCVVGHAVGCSSHTIPGTSVVRTVNLPIYVQAARPATHNITATARDRAGNTMPTRTIGTITIR